MAGIGDTLAATYDFIVVGSGSGGSVVTRRLVEAGHEVLLVEAGGDGRGVPVLEDPRRWTEIAGTEWDWGLSYAPTPEVGGRAIAIPRGRVLGGSGTTNAMMWYRGHPSDYDRWVELGCSGWSWADCLTAFRRAETWAGGPSDLRGGEGPLRVAPPADPHPLALAMIEASGQAGHAVLDDPNGASNEGAAPANFNIDAGRRFGPVEGHLSGILDAENLTVALSTAALALLWQGDRAAGVRLCRDGERHEARASRGVVLAAGAFETPRLLIGSGIGPEPTLRALGVSVVAPRADVGDNLQDHPLVRGVNFAASRALPPPRDNGGGAILNWRSEPTRDKPDLHAFPVAARSATPALAERLSKADFAICVGLMGSKSRGRLTLTGATADGPLHIDPGLLSHPDDRKALRLGIEAIKDLARQPALAALTERRLCPTEEDDLDAFLALACGTFFHPCGTARMGSDDEAVTDPRLRVNGAESLWVADASVIPDIPSCNTHSVVTMIGERAAEFILEDA
ncbi:MAG: GMC family oxidoreductase N-terminal domain-containing protein [Paracoccaceae bacterium]|nr:GMC family oxidoreductase N-terminal domain-containing protein [Paracoccaceae bacterium]